MAPEARPLAASTAAFFLVGCGPLGDLANDDPGLSAQPGRFEGRFLALSDADMAATAYADGRLEPLEDEQDTLTLFRNGAPDSRAPAARLQIFSLGSGLLHESGRIRRLRHFDLEPPLRGDDAEQRIRTVHLSPDGMTLAVDAANRRIQFYRLQLDPQGTPVAVTELGPATEDLGRRLSVGEWTLDGRFFLVTDTGWGDGTLDMLLQGPGALSVLAAPKRAGDPPGLGFFSIDADDRLRSQGVTQAVVRGPHDLVRLP